jgi:serine/threonine-protein kinase
MSLSALGEHEAARAQFTDRVKQIARADHDISYWLASAYAMEGNREEAFDWLATAIRLGNENLPWFRTNPAWKPLHEDPRFKEIMNQLEVARERRKLLDSTGEIT